MVLSLSYLMLSNYIIIFVEVAFAANQHLWYSFVDVSCIICPLNLCIVEGDAIVKSEADHEGIEAQEIVTI